MHDKSYALEESRNVKGVQVITHTTYQPTSLEFVCDQKFLI
jgi:hypothetical protein